jgi:hypothetical protein
MNGFDSLQELLASLIRPSALLELGLLVVLSWPGLGHGLPGAAAEGPTPADPDGVNLVTGLVTQGGIWFSAGAASMGPCSRSWRWGFALLARWC